jgi:DNA-binding response OmpR family regulator
VLASAPARTFTRAELVREIWSAYTPSPRSRTLDSHAHRLRCRLRAAGAGEHLIANVWGIGYRFSNFNDA